MRKTLIVLLGAAVMAALVTSPAGAHHDDGKGNVEAPPMVVLEHEFNNVVAANANEDSNAPRGHAPCIQGVAADSFGCNKVDMLSHLTLGDLGLSFANDMWGWTDPQTRKDYALVGGIEGTVIVDISDPKRPDIVGTLPAHTIVANIFWRDIKVFDDHMFVVSESLGHGMQVFDLTQVRGVSGNPVTFANTAHYNGFSNTHNLNINEDTGYAYAVGTDTCSGGLHMVDISDPANPSFAGCFEDFGYIHDTQCVIYTGPDDDYAGHEICFNSTNLTVQGSENSLSIVDVTDKTNPVGISKTTYGNAGYSHQGWLTPDQEYFLHNDELDEFFQFFGFTTTRIWDVKDLDNPTFVEFLHATTSIGHNAYTEGRYAFASNYTSGLRIYDTTSVADGVLPEVAYFDMYPENDNATFEGGTWSNYPYFHQKKVVAATSMDRGLFILQPRIGS